MRHRHDMPFGAQFLDDGRLRFRLWAPKAKRVRCLVEGRASFALVKHDDGWFEFIGDDIPAGTRYKFQIDDGPEVPDPASRFQPEDVHGPSEVVNPAAFEWQDADWTGRSWDEAVIYELHVGTFTPEGTFAGVERKLDYLRDLGVTAVELMPLSDFSGKRNWGYDGVLPFAPESSYGRPEDLKRLVQAAHSKGLMVFLDVVYNHFGPEGNYLRLYAPDFFTSRHCTPWGEGINFDGVQSRVVRNYFIHNAIYWLEEYHFDGLRFDAIHAIADDSRPDILTELAQTVRLKFGNERQVHLVLENEANAVKYMERDTNSRPKLYNAQWDDDLHHALHVLLTGEKDGYYSDYGKTPVAQLGRCLAEGFAFQNDPSAYRNGKRRGELSKHLPPGAFVSFLQNHDQIGNRAFGDRIVESAPEAKIKAAMAILLLAPQPPLIFMGEEFGARTPFLFFCDFQGDLATAVTEGRRGEFQRFAKFSDPEVRAKIPDPNAESTFTRSKLNWTALEQPEHESWLHFYREMLALRQRAIVPLLRELIPGTGNFHTFERLGLAVEWRLKNGSNLKLFANLGDDEIPVQVGAASQIIYSSSTRSSSPKRLILEPWTVCWRMEP
jgi:maltooligosyltrehalose trehalohydrolase